MNPRVAVLLLLTASCANPPAPETRSPNVVYILSDTHRWGAMSFYQTPAVQTPNLERLAREGVSFNRRYVNLPICTPDRAIFLTGRWPYQQGLIANHMKNIGSGHQPIWRAVVTEDYTYAVTEDGEYALWDNAEEY